MQPLIELLWLKWKVVSSSRKSDTDPSDAPNRWRRNNLYIVRMCKY